MGTRAGSQKMMERACQSLAGGVSSNVRAGKIPAPLFFVSGRGSHIYDVDGNSYIDYVLGQGPLILGHSPASVLAAVQKALEKGQLYAGQFETEVLVSEKLQKLIPCAELVRYSNSGSEIVQAALRLARAYTGREKIIKFEGHYHGWFDNVLISVHPPLDSAGPYEAPTPVPGTQGQSSSALSDVIVLPWNNLELLEHTIDRHGDEIAAVILEPIMCNTGCILPREGYLEGVQQLCHQHGIVLIFDEIITGFRLALGGAQQYFSVTPDLAVFGKAMGGGFPVSCLAGKQELMELIATGQVNHSGTFNSNVMVMAASLATLTALENGQIYEHLYRLGRRLMAGLGQVLERAGVQAQISGLGPMFHLAFDDGEPIYDYRSFALHNDMGKCHRFADLLLDHGVRFIPRGMWYLSAAHTDEDIDRTLEAAEAAVRAL
ncbi:MAG: aspartate aminotransferase family protein [Anaerolineae bacterium]